MPTAVAFWENRRWARAVEGIAEVKYPAVSDSGGTVSNFEWQESDPAHWTNLKGAVTGASMSKEFFLRSSSRDFVRHGYALRISADFCTFLLISAYKVCPLRSSTNTYRGVHFPFFWTHPTPATLRPPPLAPLQASSACYTPMHPATAEIGKQTSLFIFHDTP